MFFCVTRKQNGSFFSMKVRAAIFIQNRNLQVDSACQNFCPYLKHVKDL